MHWATRWSPCLPSCCQICKETLLENAKALAFMEIAGHMILFADFYSFYSYLWSFGVIQSELIIFVKATRQQYVWPFIENNSTFAPSVHIWLTTFTSKTFMVKKNHSICSVYISGSEIVPQNLTSKEPATMLQDTDNEMILKVLCMPDRCCWQVSTHIILCIQVRFRLQSIQLFSTDGATMQCQDKGTNVSIYVEKACITATHCRTKHMPHWHSWIGPEKLDRILRSVYLWSKSHCNILQIRSRKENAWLN